MSDQNDHGTNQSGPGEPTPYYILASSPQADERNRVLKHGDTFAVFDHLGDIKSEGLGEEGLYHEGTRFLSFSLLTLGRERPLFLSSTIKEDNDLLAVDLTNPDISSGGEIIVPRGTLHISRLKILWEAASYERLIVKNYGMAPVELSLAVHFAADFVDIFEVRGTRRAKRGTYLEATTERDSVVLSYRGLDNKVRRTRMAFNPAPASISATTATFRVSLPPDTSETIYLMIHCENEQVQFRFLRFDEAAELSRGALNQSQAEACCIQTTNEQFNAWVNRAVADLHMMTAKTAVGPYPYAGVPWFSTPFGRDGILTAFECLWSNPVLSRGVLAFLASNQATQVIPEQDAEPGKILHETRRGEMAALGEIPFGLYYGSVDATPLFVMLAGAYYERTGDRAFIKSIWRNIEEALNWVDRYGDADGDGFVEYSRRSPTGLANQGWKDSHDSIFHADGSLAQGAIALCEVQGYVYAAKLAAADMARDLGHAQRSNELCSEAGALRERFEQKFWCEDLGTYALALDGQKRPCRVRTSNAGHCLLTGIASLERAGRVARTLLEPESFSEWGIRTAATTERRFNPMSYHDGSVWPHDNALIAFGLARYGLKEDVLKIMTGLFDASRFVDLHRLPELFCGFIRRPGEGPTLYPVACSPQAWSAAAVFTLLQASLGLTVNAAESRVYFHYPHLPPFLREVTLTNLRVGEGSIDLLLLRHGQDVGINVLRREGKVGIMMVK